MKVSLGISERITLASSVLPSENNFTTLKVVRRIKERIGFTDVELTEFELKSEVAGNGLTRFVWNTQKELPVEFEFSDKEREIIVESLNDLGNKKKATDSHLMLFEKFSQE